MLKVAITGGLGSGKSTVIELLKKKGAVVISADAIVHKLLQAGQTVYGEIAATFGEEVVDGKGHLDKRKLADLVFVDADKHRALEAIIHPHVKEEIADRIAAMRKKDPHPAVVFVEVPLLYEAGWEEFFDRVWVITAPAQDRRRRLRENRNYSLEQFNRREKFQMPLEKKVEKADVVIDNGGDYADLVHQVEQEWEKLVGHT